MVVWVVATVGKSSGDPDTVELGVELGVALAVEDAVEDGVEEAVLDAVDERVEEGVELTVLDGVEDGVALAPPPVAGANDTAAQWFASGLALKVRVFAPALKAALLSKTHRPLNEAFSMRWVVVPLSVTWPLSL